MRGSDQFSSVAQSCLTLCNRRDCSTPGLPVHHQLPEFTQTHVHRVSDAIQPSHPLSSPSPPAFNPSQHQGLFQWVNSWHQVAKVLELQLQHQSFQWIFRTDLLYDGLAWSNDQVTRSLAWSDHSDQMNERGWRKRIKAEVTELNPKLKIDHISTMWNGDPWPWVVQLHEFYICSRVDMWVDYRYCVLLDSTANIWPESLSVLFLELLTSTKFREKAIPTSQSTFSMFLFHHRLVAKSCPTLETPMDYSLARLLCPWGFSRPEYWIGLPYPSPGDRPYPGIEPGSTALQADSLATELQGKPRLNRTCLVMIKMWLQCNI